RPILVTPMPPDEPGDAVRHRLLADGVEVRPFVVDKPLTEKQRFLVGAQKVMKLDLLEPLVLDARQQDAFISLVHDAAGAVHGATLASSGRGLSPPPPTPRLSPPCRTAAVMSGDVSSRRAHLRAMHSMDLLCPSEQELRESFGAFDRGLPTVTWQLLEETH